MIRLEALAKNSNHVPELVELFNRVWGGKTTKFWIWKYLENPLLDTAPTIVAWDNGKIVGANSFMPAEYIIQGVRCKVLQSCDTMVHPDYRCQGISTKIRCTAKQYYKNYGYKFMFGFPNAQSFPGSLKSGGLHLFDLNSFAIFHNSYSILKNYVPGFLAKICSIPVDNYHIIKQKICGYTIREFRDFKVQIYERCPQAVIDINEKIDPNVIRMGLSLKYLNWRLDSKPDIEYKYIIIEDGIQPIAYSIVSLPLPSRNKRVARIIDLDIYQEDTRIMEFLVATTIKYLIDRCDVIHLPLYTRMISYEK